MTPMIPPPAVSPDLLEPLTPERTKPPMTERIEYKCPNCGQSHFFIDVIQYADVDFLPGEAHDVYRVCGDVEWTNQSRARCAECGEEGPLSHFATDPVTLQKPHPPTPRCPTCSAPLGTDNFPCTCDVCGHPGCHHCIQFVASHAHGEAAQPYQCTECRGLKTHHPEEAHA